jgi:hypothetical protein
MVKSSLTAVVERVEPMYDDETAQRLIVAFR